MPKEDCSSLRKQYLNYSYRRYILTLNFKRSFKVRQNNNKKLNKCLALFIERDMNSYFHRLSLFQLCTDSAGLALKWTLTEESPNMVKPSFDKAHIDILRYFCEQINQTRKRSKYPVPAFVPQRAAGPKEHKQSMCVVCACLVVRVCMNGVVIPSCITVALLRLCAWWCTLIFVSACVWTQTKPVDNTATIHNQVNGVSCLFGGGDGGHCSAPIYSQATSQHPEVRQVTWAFQH